MQDLLWQLKTIPFTTAIKPKIGVQSIAEPSKLALSDHSKIIAILEQML